MVRTNKATKEDFNSIWPIFHKTIKTSETFSGQHAQDNYEAENKKLSNN